MPRKYIDLSIAAGFGVLLLLIGLTTSLAASHSRQIRGLHAQLAATQALLPTQSSAMAGVDFQASSLWFAAEADNWELANFLLAETDEHIEWAVELQPVRNTSQGPLDIRPLYDTMRLFSLREVDAAIEAEDRARFEDAYAFMLEQCHGCHVAAELGFLRPHVPAAPGAQMLAAEPPPG